MNKTKTLLLVIGTLILMTTSCTTITKNDPLINPTTNPIDNPATVLDIDGNVYHTITIGSQTWLAENLNTTKYRDGTSIPNIINDTTWAALSTGAWCNYNNDVAIGNKFGKLYNWYAVNDPHKIAPTGWHVATDVEWTTLTNYVTANPGTSVSVAKALATTTNWVTYYTDGTIGRNLAINNSSGFRALPGGNRFNNDGAFNDVGCDGYWWSSTEGSAVYAYGRYLSYNSSNVNSNNFTKSCGFSVRCVKD